MQTAWSTAYALCQDDNKSEAAYISFTFFYNNPALSWLVLPL